MIDCEIIIVKERSLTLKVTSVNTDQENLSGNTIKKSYRSLFEKLRQVLFSLASCLVHGSTKDSRKWQL